MTTPASWLRCYRCWSQNLEVQVHYEGALKVDAQTGETQDPGEATIEAVVQCTDCLHDQPHLAFSLHEEEGRPRRTPRGDRGPLGAPRARDAVGRLVHGDWWAPRR